MPAKRDMERAQKLVGATAEEIARALEAERMEMVKHVGATSDEYGMELEESVCRLSELLDAAHRGDDPDTFDRYHAPKEDDPGQRDG